MIASADPKELNELSTEPLRALVVSRDQNLHRQLQHHLQDAEYGSIHTTSVAHALSLIESTPCHVLLVDADLPGGEALELCREANTTARGEPLAKLLLQSPTTELEMVDLLHAGVDDLLAKPIGYLELLARIRAGVRAFEFRRRVADQLGIEPTTHLPNENTLREYVERLSAADSATTMSCLVLKVDHVQHMAVAHGNTAIDQLALAMAELLTREQLENEMLSYWGQGTFCLACSEQAAAESVARAEELSQSLSVAMANRSLAFPVSVSVGIAENTENRSGGELIENACQALQTAQISGGACVVLFGANHDSAHDSYASGDTGNVFQNTLAADLMTPCIVNFSETHGAWHAACLMRRHKLPAAPLIDSGGKCVGIIDQEQLPASPEQAINKNVNALRSQHAEMCGEDTVLSDIMQRLGEGDTQWLVITRHGRPTGMISRDQLAAFGQPLTVNSLRVGSSSQPQVRLEELLVPECSA